MKDFQYITNAHPSYIEGLYQDFVKDPNSVEPEMKKFFEGFDFALSSGHLAVGGLNSTTHHSLLTTDTVDWMSELRVYRMILGYRNKGHLLADTNPIRKRKDRGANLGLNYLPYIRIYFDGSSSASGWESSISFYAPAGIQLMTKTGFHLSIETALVLATQFDPHLWVAFKYGKNF